jgi:aspartate aminotransferase-like enzyme
MSVSPSETHAVAALLHYDNAATGSLPAEWQPSHVLSAIEAARQHLENLGCRHRYERGECLSCVLRAELRQLGIDVPSNWTEPFSAC